MKRLLLLSLFFLLLWALPSAACPNCKEAVASNAGSGGQLTEGWTRSIALLMATPYLLFGGMTLFIIRASRRNKQKAS